MISPGITSSSSGQFRPHLTSSHMIQDELGFGETPAATSHLSEYYELIHLHVSPRHGDEEKVLLNPTRHLGYASRR